MKKVFYWFCTLAFCFILTGCGNQEKNIKGNLNDIMDKLYAGVKEKDGSTEFARMELTVENFKDYTAIENVNYKEALVSEDATGFITHIVIPIRLEDSKDADKIVEDLKKTHNAEDWVCGAPDYIYTLSKGDLVALIVGNEPVLKIKENFENLE